jgi:outer membrane protein OmpA-like peptidoglycan-associated protein
MSNRTCAAPVLICVALGWAGVASAFDVRVRSMTLMEGRDRPAMVLVPDAAVKEIALSLQRGDGTSIRRTGGPYAAGQEVVFEWDQPVGTASYSGTLTVVYKDGEQGVMEPAFSIVVLAPLEVQVPRERVDLEARTLEVLMSRPAGQAWISVIADTGEVIDEGHAPFNGEPPGTPLQVTWSQGDQTVIRIDVKGYDEHGFWAGVELSPWWVEIPHEEVVFDTGQSGVRADQASKLESTYALIDEAVQTYGHLVDIDLFVVGYTDTQGGPASNQTLSESRARSIARWLQRRGFAGDVFYQGFGEQVLAVPTPDEFDEERNRRAVYVLAAEMPPISGGIPEQDWRPL